MPRTQRGVQFAVAQVFALADAIGPQYRAFILTAALTTLRLG